MRGRKTKTLRKESRAKKGGKSQEPHAFPDPAGVNANRKHGLPALLGYLLGIIRNGIGSG